jgi:hypothetical protein
MPDPQADLTTALADQLRRSGETRTRYHTDQERDLLRKAGRAAGRQLGRPVRTFDQPSENGGLVFVVITDWGQDNPLERQLHEVRANNLIDRALEL